MRPDRLWRLACACRPPRAFLVFVFASCIAGPADAADAVSGRIVDSTGHGVPRAHVRVFDRAGRETVRTFADDEGRFEVSASDSTMCRVEVALTGFQTATVPCGREPLHITLDLAPVQDSVIVTATRTPAPASQAGASATVFTADDIERRQMPLVADLLRLSPGATVIRSGSPGSVT